MSRTRSPTPECEFERVDVASLELLRPRSVGVEQVALWAMQQVQLLPLLQRLGLNGPQRAAAVGSIIGRMAAPGSERATYRWLCQRSALGELLEVDFETMSMMRLYRAAVVLVRHQQQIEGHLFDGVTELFGRVWHYIRSRTELAERTGLPLPSGQPGTHAALGAVYVTAHVRICAEAPGNRRSYRDSRQWQGPATGGRTPTTRGVLQRINTRLSDGFGFERPGIRELAKMQLRVTMAPTTMLAMG